jgi:chromosome segregation ATPase
MPVKPIPPSQIPAHQIDSERRELSNLRDRLSDENRRILTLRGALGEIEEKETAAREILKLTSPNCPTDAYERRRATEALQDLAEERAQIEELLRRRRVIIKDLNSRIDGLHVGEINRREKIDNFTTKIG